MPLFKIKYKLFFISLLSIFLSIDAARLLADKSPLEKISLEGFYVKDKLLNYYSEREISNFLSDEEYIEIGTNQNLSQFDYLNLIFQNNKRKGYPIVFLKGFINFSDNQKCLSRKDKILNEISPSFNKDTLRRDDVLSDRTGKNQMFQTHIFLEYGDEIKLQCIDLDEQYQIETKDFEGFIFLISTNRYSNFLNK